MQKTSVTNRKIKILLSPEEYVTISFQLSSSPFPKYMLRPQRTDALSRATLAFYLLQKIQRYVFVMFLSTKPMHTYPDKQSLHLPWILSAHSPATLLYRTVSMCQSPTSKHVSELSENISCYMTALILMYKQVIFKYFKFSLIIMNFTYTMYFSTHTTFTMFHILGYWLMTKYLFQWSHCKIWRVGWALFCIQ